MRVQYMPKLQLWLAVDTVDGKMVHSVNRNMLAAMQGIYSLQAPLIEAGGYVADSPIDLDIDSLVYAKGRQHLRAQKVQNKSA